MTKVYIVRGEQSGAPESIIFGVYPTEALAAARVEFLEDDEAEEWSLDYVWFDVVTVGPNGADCEIYNR